MRASVCTLVLVVAVGAELRDGTRSLNTGKRVPAQGEAGLKKRAPALSTASSPVNAGVEYADTKQQPADKSPSQRVYASAGPQAAKFSDLLAGQAPSYQAAIASQLFAPVSVYQPRSGAPVTYEVSAPVPSQLAYSEHYQQPTAAQFTQQLHNAKESTQQQISQSQFLAQAQQIYSQPAQQTYQQLPQLEYQQPIDYNQMQPVQYQAQRYRELDNQQPLQTVQYQQAPNAVYSDGKQNVIPVQYKLAPQSYYPEQPQQQVYIQQQPLQQAYVQQQPVQNVQYVQPALTYVRQEEVQQNVYNRPELKNYVKQQAAQQNYQVRPQGPVSFASFSQHQPTQSIIHHPYHQQDVQQVQYSQPQTASLPLQSHERLSHFRQGPQLQIAPQSQVFQQAQPQNQYLTRLNPGYTAQPAAPVFPPVQYFGKYAQSIFNKN